MLFTSLISFLTFIIALLVAITIHEFAHAAVADHLGDPTPKLAGRLTLNPLAHLDPLGTLMLFLFRFGWGKPVPVDPFNLRDPRRDQALISLAGPASNLILAVILSLILHLGGAPSGHPRGVFVIPLISLLLNYLISPLIFLNVTLAIFNLLPVHPLDGFKIVHGFLPPELAAQWEELTSLGPLILFLLVFPITGRSIISLILNPILNWVLQILIPYGYTLI